jgi:hypothetical protein
VLSQAPAERQTVFFSATMPSTIQHLVKKFTRNPAHIRIEAQAMVVPEIEQVYYEIDRRNKLEVLCRLIDLQDIKYGIIFCGTKMMVAHSSDIRVYINAECTSPFRFHHRFEGNIPPGRLVQRRDDALFPIQWPAYRRAHSHDFLFCRDFGDHTVDICQVCFQTGRCVCSRPSQNVALAVRCRNHDLCSAYVQPNKHRHRQTS